MQTTLVEILKPDAVKGYGSSHAPWPRFISPLDPLRPSLLKICFSQPKGLQVALLWAGKVAA